MYWKHLEMLMMLIVRHLGTPNSDFNGCHRMRDPVLYRSIITTNKYINVMQTFPIVEKLNSEKVRKMRNLNNVYP